MNKKTRVVKTCSTKNLILSRLPVKSLLRFRCMSISWKSIINNPDFARLHLNSFKNNTLQSHLFFTKRSPSENVEFVIRSSKTLRKTTSFGFVQSNLDSIGTLRTSPTPNLEWVHCWVIDSTIDGLFILRNLSNIRKSGLMLWNPSIRKTLILPPPPEICRSSYYCQIYPTIKDVWVSMKE